MMKKFYRSTIAAVVTFIFVLAWGTTLYASYNSSVVYIKGSNDYNWSYPIEANTNFHYLDFNIQTYNNINVKWWIKDQTTGVTVKSGKRYDAGTSYGSVYGLYGKKYSLYLMCDDTPWNNDSCNARGVIDNY